MPVGMSVNYNSNNSEDGGGSGFQYLRTKLVVGKGAGRAYFLDQTEDGFDAQGNTVQVYRSVKFNMEDLPKFPQIPADTTIEECQVVLDKENKIVGISPFNGSYKGKAIDLGPKTPDGSKPMSRTKERQNKNRKPGQKETYTDVSFWCILQITDHETDGGLFVGSTPYMFLKDKFYRRPDDGMTDIMGDQSKGNTHAVRLNEWGDTLRLWREDIPWPEDGNVLPELLRRIQANNDEVLIIIKKGRVDSIQPIRGSVVRTVAVFKDDEPAAEPLPMKDAAVSAGAADETFGK